MSDTYTTRQGDTWDLISFRLSGSVEQTVALMQANPKYSNIFVFSAGIVLDVPDFEAIVDQSTLPPWRRDELMEDG